MSVLHPPNASSTFVSAEIKFIRKSKYKRLWILVVKTLSISVHEDELHWKILRLYCAGCYDTIPKNLELNKIFLVI